MRWIAPGSEILDILIQQLQVIAVVRPLEGEPAWKLAQSFSNQQNVSHADTRQIQQILEHSKLWRGKLRRRIAFHATRWPVPRTPNTYTQIPRTTEKAAAQSTNKGPWMVMSVYSDRANQLKTRRDMDGPGYGAATINQHDADRTSKE